MSLNLSVNKLNANYTSVTNLVDDNYFLSLNNYYVNIDFDFTFYDSNVENRQYIPTQFNKILISNSINFDPQFTVELNNFTYTNGFTNVYTIDPSIFGDSTNLSDTDITTESYDNAKIRIKNWPLSLGETNNIGGLRYVYIKFIINHDNINITFPEKDSYIITVRWIAEKPLTPGIPTHLLTYDPKNETPYTGTKSIWQFETSESKTPNINNKSISRYLIDTLDIRYRYSTKSSNRTIPVSSIGSQTNLTGTNTTLSSFRQINIDNSDVENNTTKSSLITTTQSITSTSGLNIRMAPEANLVHIYSTNDAPDLGFIAKAKLEVQDNKELSFKMFVKDSSNNEISHLVTLKPTTDLFTTSHVNYFIDTNGTNSKSLDRNDIPKSSIINNEGYIEFYISQRSQITIFTAYFTPLNSKESFILTHFITNNILLTDENLILGISFKTTATSSGDNSKVTIPEVAIFSGRFLLSADIGNTSNNENDSNGFVVSRTTDWSADKISDKWIYNCSNGTSTLQGNKSLTIKSYINSVPSTTPNNNIYILPKIYDANNVWLNTSESPVLQTLSSNIWFSLSFTIDASSYSTASYIVFDFYTLDGQFIDVFFDKFSLVKQGQTTNLFLIDIENTATGFETQGWFLTRTKIRKYDGSWSLRASGTTGKFTINKTPIVPSTIYVFSCYAFLQITSDIQYKNDASSVLELLSSKPTYSNKFSINTQIALNNGEYYIALTSVLPTLGVPIFSRCDGNTINSEINRNSPTICIIFRKHFNQYRELITNIIARVHGFNDGYNVFEQQIASIPYTTDNNFTLDFSIKDLGTLLTIYQGSNFIKTAQLLQQTNLSKKGLGMYVATGVAPYQQNYEYTDVVTTGYGEANLKEFTIRVNPENKINSSKFDIKYFSKSTDGQSKLKSILGQGLILGNSDLIDFNDNQDNVSHKIYAYKLDFSEIAEDYSILLNSGNKPIIEILEIKLRSIDINNINNIPKIRLYKDNNGNPGRILHQSWISASEPLGNKKIYSNIGAMSPFNDTVQFDLTSLRTVINTYLQSNNVLWIYIAIPPKSEIGGAWNK